MNRLCGRLRDWADASVRRRITQLSLDLDVANNKIAVMQALIDEQAAALARNLKRTEAESAVYAKQIASVTG